MRIALTHPFCWPYVRRGAERFIAEFAGYLVQRGHEVITISSKPGKSIVEATPAGRRILHRQLWTPFLSRFRITPAHAFAASLGCSLASLRVDVVHSLSYFDAWMANGLRSWKGYRTVYQVTGPPVPHWFPRIPPDRYVIRSAIHHSDRCMVHSEFTGRILRETYGVDARVIPVPIDLNAFPQKTGSGPERATILAMASFDDRRKGLRVLIDAFRIVKRNVPEALLVLSGHMSPELRDEVIERLPTDVRTNIEVLGVGDIGGVPRLYREASLTVLPSMWEAYGMSILESWASGTPVVVTNHAGLPELVDDSTLGLTFDPLTNGQETRNAEGLAAAIVQALPLAYDPMTARRCRAKAEGYSWELLGPQYEALYAPG